MMRNGRIGLGLYLLTLIVAPRSQAASWPYFRRDEGRTGFASEEAAPPLTPVWTFNIPAQTVSSPVAAYGHVYIGARNNIVYCLNAQTGAQVWSFTTNDWIDATPAVASATVFAPSRDGYLYALNANTGGLLWKYATGSKDVGSPVYWNGIVYGATSYPNRLLYALNANTGLPVKTAVLSQFATSSPVIDKSAGVLYLGTSDGRYNAWNLNLSPVVGFSTQTSGNIYWNTPAAANGTLIAAPGDDDRRLVEFGSGAKISWASTSLSTTSNLATSVAVSADTAYVGSGVSPHSLYALSLSTGGVRWSLPLGDAGTTGLESSPAVANDVVYVLSPQGVLYGVSASTGGVLAAYNLGTAGQSSPAVSNGWVYAADANAVYGFQAARAFAVSGPDPIIDPPVQDTVTITGTIASPQLQSYSVDYGSGTNPTQWTNLARGNQPVTAGVLALWDTSALNDSTYSIRLSVQEKSGNSVTTTTVSYPYTVNQIKSMSIDPHVDAVLSLADGTEVDIPAGALGAADTLNIHRLNQGQYQDAGLPANTRASSIVREFYLGSTLHPTFLKPITIKMPYSSVQFSNENNLRIFYYDDASRQYWMVNTSMVSKTDKRVWASVNHFTVFRVVEISPGGPLLDATEVYTYPNPATGNTVTFKFALGDTANVSIKIFDVAARLVATLSQDGNPIGNASTLNWDISGRASGVYIYELEATSISGVKAQVIKKLAIIH